MIKKIYESYSEEATKKIGRAIGKVSQPGEIYCLEGALGVGKTIFSKGFGEGLGITELITSPTFTLIQVYTSGRIPFYHFDVYRIGNPYELDEIGYEDYFYGEGVSMVEWASKVEPLLPKEAIRIVIEKDLEKGLDYRRISKVGGHQ